VTAALEAMVDGRTSARLAVVKPRVGLYRSFLKVINAGTLNSDPTAQVREGPAAERRIAALTPRARQAFLLMAVEDFDIKEAATILETSEDEVRFLIDQAGQEIAGQVATNVVIIEDEPLIAMDLRYHLQSLGHHVSQIARTHKQALAAVEMHQPGLVLADIELADGSSGLVAVNEIVKRFSVPVIFVTAYPERLLTGDRPEPTFLIAKPFQPEALKAVVSQALFFEINARPEGRDRATA